jgi:hypothetical protein
MLADPPARPGLAAWARRPAVWQSAAGVLAALVGALLLVLFLPGPSRPAVATVDGTAISRATFDHWLNSAARTAASQNPGIPSAPPDPPRYSRCISQLQRVQGAARQHAPAASLSKLCAADFTTLRNAALQLLIDSNWVLKQGRREHVVIPPATIDSDLARYEQSTFHDRASLRKYLAGVGQTESDLRFQIAVSLTSTRLAALHVAPQASVPPADVQSYYSTHRSQYPNQTLTQVRSSITRTLAQQQQQQALAAYTQQFEGYWRSRTSCASGFRVASLCANVG